MAASKIVDLPIQLSMHTNRPNSMTRHTFVSIALGVALSAMGGCGGNDFGPMGTVSGKVTLDGKPVEPDTKVIFMQGTKGYTGFGIVKDAGQYRIEWRRSGTTYDGLPLGNYDVMLVPAGAVDVDEMSAEEMLAGGPKKSTSKAVLPARYLRTTTSGLTFEVAAGDNAIDIELKSK